MDFWRTVAVLFRRWYITVPAFFATLGLAAAAYSVVPLQYESGSTLLLTTPLTGATESTDPEHTEAVTNPLMNFDRSLALAASLIIQELRSSEGAEALGIVPGGTTGFEVNNGSSNPELLESGPFIFIRGKGSSPEAAQDVTTKVATMAAAILSSRQEELNAPPSTHIELQVVVAPKPGQPLLGSPLRAAAGAAGLAALASLVAVYGFESLMVHRRRRRRRAGGQRETDEEDSATATAPESSRARPTRPLEPDDSVHLVHANGTSEER
jgi:hypothetical protein